MTDWSALGGNPVPGDPGGIRAAAHTLDTFAGNVAQQARLLASTSDDTTLTWKGTAGNSFRSLAGSLAPVLDNTVSSHRDAAEALDTFATQLQGFQTTAHQLLGQAQQAVRVGAAAQKSVTSLTTQVQTATTAYNTAASAPQPAHPNLVGPVPDPALATASQNLTSCKSQLSTAQGDLAAAEKSFANAQSQATTLHAHAQAAAQTCATKVNKAGEWAKIKTELGSLNDKAGWFLNAWGSYGGFVSSDKLFNLVKADAAYKAADAAEDAAFTKWNESDSGYFDWAKSVKEENAARSAAKSAHDDFDDSFDPAAADGLFTKLIGRVGLGVGMLSDVITMIDPSPSFGPDGLLGGNTDRVMAGLNFAASGLALGDSMGLAMAGTAMAIPGVDVVVGAVLIGTAAYFAGEFVYQHWHAITHFVSGAAHTVAHLASSAWHDATSWL